MSTCEEQDMLLKFSLKKVVSLSRGHVVGNTHLNFGFSKGGLKVYKIIIISKTTLCFGFSKGGLKAQCCP